MVKSIPDFNSVNKIWKYYDQKSTVTAWNEIAASYK